MKVLIVDDSDLIRERIITLLNGNSIIEIVEQVKTAGEAIQYIKNNRVDTVILDIRLPDESGLFVLEKIKKDKPQIKVIIFTNYPFPQYMKKSEELGADYFLHKVSEFNQLRQVLEKVENNLLF